MNKVEIIKNELRESVYVNNESIELVCECGNLFIFEIDEELRVEVLMLKEILIVEIFDEYNDSLEKFEIEYFENR